jgi:ribose transport system substrate-binding protein
MSKGIRVPRRITRRDFLGLAAASAGAAMLGACGGQGGGGQGYRMFLIVGVTGDEFFTSMECGAQDKARELGVDLTVQGPQEFDASQQTPVLNGAVQSNPDAILIAPTDARAMVAPIRSAVDAGIPVFTVDTFIEEDLALAHISSDNVEGGKLAAQGLVEAIGEEGKVLLVNVKPGISTTDQRQQGFEGELGNYPNIEYLGAEFCDDDPTKAASIASSAFQSNPDLAGIFGANVFSGQGAATGVQEQGAQDQVAIVGFDASTTQVNDLRNEVVDALIAQHPEEIGSTGVQTAFDYLESQQEPSEREIDTGLTIVTRDNLEDSEVQRYLYKAEC